MKIKKFSVGCLGSIGLVLLVGLSALASEKSYGPCNHPGTWASTKMLSISGPYIPLSCDGDSKSYVQMSNHNLSNLINWYFSKHEDEFLGDESKLKKLVALKAIDEKYAKSGPKSLVPEDIDSIEKMLAEAHGAYGSEVCSQMKAATCKLGGGLSCVSKTLYTLGVTEKRVSAISAKHSIEAFIGNGFEDIYTKNKTLLKNIDQIPEGAVVVLAKENSDCPVSKDFGNVAIKCGADQMVWGGNNNGKAVTQSLKNIADRHPECIKSILMSSKIHADPSSKTEKDATATNAVK